MRRCLLAAVFSVALAAQAGGGFALHGSVGVRHIAGAKGDAADVVVWLTPIGHAAIVTPPAAPFQMVQKDKTFQPRLLVVPAGSMVEFPNRDPFFHNVFSVGASAAFDLGLHQTGEKPMQERFQRAGVSYVFCNIHPEMSAVVLAVPTPWFAVTGADGSYAMQGVPAGSYTLHVWYERADPAALANLDQHITVGADAALPQLVVNEIRVRGDHLNKFGQPYDVTHGYGGGGQ